MAEILDFPDLPKIEKTLDGLSARAVGWWGADNSMRAALHTIAIPDSLKKWVGRVVCQAWMEGAVTGVQEYGDEVREQRREMDDLFDLQWNAEMRGIKKWQEETGQSLTLPDKAEFTLWLLHKAFPSETDAP